MKIYIDLIFIQDMIIMALILFLFSKLINAKVSMFKILVISIISSIFSILTLLYIPIFYDNILIKIVAAILIIRFGFNVSLKDEIISKIILLWLIIVLFGGIGFITEGNFLQMIILFTIVGSTILIFKLKNRKTLLLEAATCFIEFEYKGINYNFKSLLDTGHDVKTFYDEDIIFVKEDLFKAERGEKNKKRMVSYKTVSGTDTKTGIKINNISITYGQKKIFNNAVIVSTPNILNNFDAIVGVSLIEGGWSYGNTNFNQTKSEKTIS